MFDNIITAVIHDPTKLIYIDSFVTKYAQLLLRWPNEGQRWETKRK